MTTATVDVQPAPLTVPTLLATNITASSSGAPRTDAPAVVDFAAAISEVQLRTQIAGASTLTLTIIDPDDVIATAGFLDSNDDGLIDAIEVEFPASSGSWWRLSAIEGTTDLTTPNLTLVFEDRIVAYLRDHYGAKTVAPGTTSRAQFIKSLVDEIGATTAVAKIRFVCPSINVTQPVETTDDTGTTTVVSSKAAAATKSAKANKKRHVHPDAAISIAGQSPTQDQIDNINTLLGEAELLKAGPIATQALLYAAIGESRVGGTPGTFKPNSAGYWGVLQGSTKNWPDPHDVAGQANSFLTGGKGFQAGGAMALSRTVSNPVEIAVRVEAPSIWPDNAYAREPGEANFLPEAKAIINSYGGVALGSSGATGVPKSDIGQLARGTTDDPDENSWDCGNRLAQQVNWFLFSNANNLYYMDGPDLIAQRPALYLDCQADKASIASMSYNVDNTTYLRSAGNRTSSRLSKAASPAEVQLSLVCEIDDYRAGDVFVLRNKGPVNGRWIVSDATRNCLADTFTSFTLVPPTAPTPEPQGQAGPVADPTNPSGGTASGNPTGPAGAKGLTTFDGVPVSSWIVPVLKWARANDWTGKVNSGWRSDSDQLAAASQYAASKGQTVAEVYPNGPLASNHCKKDYPGGAVDVSQPQQLAAALLNYKDKPTLVWGGPTIEDAVHFSSDGH